MNNIYKFTGKAETYAKYRPTYPQAYIDYLFKSVNLNRESVIAEIGSGTGILLKQLLERHSCVIGVEPNDDMRGIAERTLSGYPGFISHIGTAENTLLENRSVDLIVAAQSFHWFDPDLFRKECRRILKPDAPVNLVWNTRDNHSELVIQNAGICQLYCPDFHGFSGGKDSQNPEVFENFFRDGRYELMTFDNPQSFDLDGFIGRNLSASYAPLPGSQSREKFIEALTELFHSLKGEDGKVVMSCYTRSYLGLV